MVVGFGYQLFENKMKTSRSFTSCIEVSRLACGEIFNFNVDLQVLFQLSTAILFPGEVLHYHSQSDLSESSSNDEHQCLDLCLS